MKTKSGCNPFNPATERRDGVFHARPTQVVAILPLVAIGAIAFIHGAAVGFGPAHLRQLWDRLAPNVFSADIYRTVIRIVAVMGGIVVALDVVLRETANLPQALEHGRARPSFPAWIDQRDRGLSNARGDAMRVVVSALTDKDATPFMPPKPRNPRMRRPWIKGLRRTAKRTAKMTV